MARRTQRGADLISATKNRHNSRFPQGSDADATTIAVSQDRQRVKWVHWNINTEATPGGEKWNIKVVQYVEHQNYAYRSSYYFMNSRQSILNFDVIRK